MKKIMAILLTMILLVSLCCVPVHAKDYPKLAYFLDEDKDGLSDYWEVNGIDVDGDGVVEVNLPEMGADPKVPDIFVEVDYMVKDNESLLPDLKYLKNVVDVFKSHNINLHLDLGKDSIDYANDGKKWGNNSRSNEVAYKEDFHYINDWPTYYIDEKNFEYARRFAFRYAIMVDHITWTEGKDVAGLAIANNQFFVVDTTKWGMEWTIFGASMVSVVFMHELGHTLGLKDDESVDGKETGSDYLSVMSSPYSLRGIKGEGLFGVFNYYVDYSKSDWKNLKFSVGKIGKFGKVSSTEQPVKKGFPFTDVPNKAWFKDNVKSAYEKGLINGKSNKEFKPNDNMTYAEAVKLASCVNQYFYLGKVSLKNGKNKWYDTYMQYALKNGIIKKDLSSKANSKINRKEFVKMFYSSVPKKWFTPFNYVRDGAIPDVKSSEEAIYTFYRAGILGGNDENGTFNPNDNITRAEVAAIVTRIIGSSDKVKVNLK